MNTEENEIADIPALAMDPSLCSDLTSFGDLQIADHLGLDEVSCAPLKTLEQIWTWRSEPWTKLVIDLAPRTPFMLPGNRINCIEGVQPRFLRDSAPKTLFCHDMKGGYLEDRFVNGSSRHDAYRFFHWAGLDSFIYFSHHLLTIPPLSWINSGHLHAVPVLGTFITEGESGEKVWQQILINESTVIRFADTLASICRHYRFDGYLLNVENKIPAAQVPLLLKFVSELKSSFRRLGLRQAQVIWYDSVTCDGDLSWQNELNEKNRCFFDACDAIFLNYTWTEQHLKRSLETAGSRCLDVYVGVDVFGRNCYGGGGFDTDKAFSMIRSFGLSVALFAAGWTHEVLDQRNFTMLEYLFWQKLWPYLYIHGPIRLPFSTSFCQGYGKTIFRNGASVTNANWHNLRKQQYQPCVPSALEHGKIHGSHIKNKTEGSSQSETDPPVVSGPVCITEEIQPSPVDYFNQGYVAHHSEEAFHGGGCLKVGGLGSHSLKRLLVCGFRNTGILLFSTATKSPVITNPPVLNITLLIQDRESRYWKHVLLGSEERESTFHLSECGVKLHLPISSSEIARVKGIANDECARKQLNVQGRNGWQIRHFLLEVDGIILEIGCDVSSSREPALLGWIALSKLDG